MGCACSKKSGKVQDVNQTFRKDKPGYPSHSTTYDVVSKLTQRIGELERETVSIRDRVSKLEARTRLTEQNSHHNNDRVSKKIDELDTVNASLREGVSNHEGRSDQTDRHNSKLPFRSTEDREENNDTEAVSPVLSNEDLRPKTTDSKHDVDKNGGTAVSPVLSNEDLRPKTTDSKHDVDKNDGTLEFSKESEPDQVVSSNIKDRCDVDDHARNAVSPVLSNADLCPKTTDSKEIVDKNDGTSDFSKESEPDQVFSSSIKDMCGVDDHARNAVSPVLSNEDIRPKTTDSEHDVDKNDGTLEFSKESETDQVVSSNIKDRCDVDDHARNAVSPVLSNADLRPKTTDSKEDVDKNDGTSDFSKESEPDQVFSSSIKDMCGVDDHARNAVSPVLSNEDLRPKTTDSKHDVDKNDGTAVSPVLPNEDLRPKTTDSKHDVDKNDGTLEFSKESEPDQVVSSNIKDRCAVDDHARNAPGHVRKSVPELVKYLTTGTKDPKLHVRAFFVWITNNISYDTDGFFGRSQYVSCDAGSVLKHGKGVCQSYANLMEALCKEANIPSKTISGYAKGYGYSPKNPLTTKTETNHAWTAVQLDGKWFLIDATWGAGTVDKSGIFERKFNNFYYLTDPEKFATNHFPYMNQDMKASSKWQLLNKPISLRQFNDSLKIGSEAFRLGVFPKSHKNAIIRMKNETTVAFTKPKENNYHFMSSLLIKSGNNFEEVPRSTFDIVDDGEYSVRLHPRTTGSYRLRLFGREATEDDTVSMGYLFEYLVECTAVKDADFEFPYCHTHCQTDKCVLIAPTKYRLKANSEVLFHVQSPLLKEVMVDWEMFEKTGNTFKGHIKVGSPGKQLWVFGTTDANINNYHGLYRFEVAN